MGHSEIYWRRRQQEFGLTNATSKNTATKTLQVYYIQEYLFRTNCFDILPNKKLQYYLIYLYVCKMSN